MKSQIVNCGLGATLLATTLTAAPLALTTGCVSHHQETAGAYVDDNKIVASIKTRMYQDPMVKGTEIKVESLNGVVDLSGFVDSLQARDRAAEIAISIKGVARVYNNLILPTGR